MTNVDESKPGQIPGSSEFQGRNACLQRCPSLDPGGSGSWDFSSLPSVHLDSDLPGSQSEVGHGKLEENGAGSEALVSVWSER